MFNKLSHKRECKKRTTPLNMLENKLRDFMFWCGGLLKRSGINKKADPLGSAFQIMGAAVDVITNYPPLKMADVLVKETKPLR